MEDLSPISLAPLRTLVESFARIQPSAPVKSRQKQLFLRQAELAGRAAWPFLLRSVSSEIDQVANTAAYVLSRLTEETLERRMLDMIATGRESELTQRRILRVVMERSRREYPRLSQEADLFRGLWNLDHGRPGRARQFLVRFVDQNPDRSDARSALGICLLRSGEHSLALGEFERAAELRPDEAVHTWNWAAAAHHADRLSLAYLAMRNYLRLRDSDDDAPGRTFAARDYIEHYENMVLEPFSDATLQDCLRGKERYAMAHALLVEGFLDEAATEFEQVLAMEPAHYPSWGNLGLSYFAQARFIEARRAFELALKICPTYALAEKNLRLLTGRSPLHRTSSVR